MNAKLMKWSPLLALAVLLAAAAASGAEPAPPTTDPAAEGAAVAAKLEELDATVQRGLAGLAEGTKGVEAERKVWASLDRSIASARAVNKAVGDRNKLVVKLYDTHVSGALAEFGAKLKAAPPVYRRMAVVRKGQAAAASQEFERRSYQAMADLCESAAVLCERRYAEVFGDGAPPVAGKSRPVTASSLAETVANMRKMGVVHDRWEETFAAYPSALDQNELSTLFDQLSAYAEDVEAFTKGVESLNAVIKQRRAPEPKTAPAEPLASAPPASKVSPDPVAAAPRKLSDQELDARIQAARRSVVAQLQPGRAYLLPEPQRVKVLPARIDHLTVYVVSGAPPATGRVPTNVVYDSEPASPPLVVTT